MPITFACNNYGMLNIFSWTLNGNHIFSDSIYDLLQILFEGLAKQAYAKICFSPNTSSVISVSMLQLTYAWGKVVDKINIYIYAFFLRFSCFEVVLRLLGAVKMVHSGARLHTYSWQRTINLQTTDEYVDRSKVHCYTDWRHARGVPRFQRGRGEI